MNGRKLLNECPAVIGMITATLQSGNSMDTAARTISSEGPQLSSIIFGKAVRSADVKAAESVSEGIKNELLTVPKEAEGYRRAVLMAISASETSDTSMMNKMLDESSEIALESIKEMGESYGSALTAPCMTIFGLGIMMPVIVLSILPIMGIGGVFGSFAMDQRFLILLTLIMIPAAIVMTSLWIRSGNPFRNQNPSLSDLMTIAPLLSSIPLYFISANMFEDSPLLLLTSMAPACVATAILMVEDVHKEHRRRTDERMLMDSFFDMGNRMVSGMNFETAAVSSISGRERDGIISDSLSKQFVFCRGDRCAAIDRTIGRVSEEAGLAFKSLLLCSEKDSDDAGKLAMTLGRQYQNRCMAQKDMEIKLKSFTDMLIGTSVFFAPLVLGLSVAMLCPLSMITDLSTEGTTTIMGVYLIELNATISLLMSSIGEDSSIRSVVWRFSVMCPISLLVFSLCTMFGS